jgi:hypothetical protein
MPLALFTDSTPLTPIRNLFNTIIQQVNKQEVVNYADLDALPSTAGLTEGTRAHVDELNVDFQVQDGSWVQVGTSRFASTGARDTAYAKASGTYLVANVGALVTATTPGIEYAYDGTAWRATNAPSAMILPTGQVNGTVDATTGRVTVTGSAGSVSVLGAFSSAYRTHRITWDLTCGGAAALSFVFRASGSDVVTAYDWLRHHAQNSTDATSNALNQASMLVGVNGITGRHWGSIEVIGAADSAASLFNIIANASSNPMTATTVERLEVTGLHRTATAYTDFSLIASTGSLTAGWVRVEGIV